jgi:hypothetical protein
MSIVRGSKEWHDRLDTLLTEESAIPKRWHYCSFASEKCGFLGGLFIEGNGIGQISLLTHMLGLNPGGEMICLPIPDDAPMPLEKYRNRLLTKQELTESCAESGGIVNIKGETVQP